MKLAIHAVLTTGLLMTLSTPVQADPNANGVSIGMLEQSTTRYSGSSSQYWQWVPVLQARDNAVFIDTLNGAGYDLQAANGLYLEHTLGYSWGRTDHNSVWRNGAENLKGMGNIPGALNTSIAIGQQVTPWFIPEIKTTLPLTDAQGAQYQASLTLMPVQNTVDTVAVTITALGGDSRYTNTFYGVSRSQSQHSKYSEYHPDGGIYATEAALNASHQFSPSWGMLVNVSNTWLSGSSAKSPLVERRSAMSVGTGVLYTFQ